jgi:predicted N-acetyltransferase YhbS
MTAVLSLAQIAPEAVEQLLDDAFGPDRHQRTAYKLRMAGTEIGALSFGIMDEGMLTASIQCWPVRIGATPLVLVGPVAVAPDRQGKGLGHRLMHATLDAAALIGDPAMVMIGDPEYYGRFGFTAQQTGGWTLPGPWETHRLLARNPAQHNLPATGMLERADAL